jgi:hypothetical protein
MFRFNAIAERKLLKDLWVGAVDCGAKGNLGGSVAE